MRCWCHPEFLLFIVFHWANQSIPNLRHGRLSHALNIASEFALDWDAIVGHPEVGSLVEDNTKVRTVSLRSSCNKACCANAARSHWCMCSKWHVFGFADHCRSRCRTFSCGIEEWRKNESLFVCVSATAAQHTNEILLFATPSSIALLWFVCSYLRDEVFSKVDALVTPTVPISAPVVPPSVLARGENNVALNVELLKCVSFGCSP